MTNEDKLKKLLEIAFENSWKSSTNVVYLLFLWLQNNQFIKMEIDVENCIIVNTDSTDFQYVSLNDLVANFEVGEVSFIGALCRDTSIHTYFLNSPENQKLLYLNLLKLNLDIAEIVRIFWNITPTSERLYILFTAFSHLLQG